MHPVPIVTIKESIAILDLLNALKGAIRVISYMKFHVVG